MGYERSDGYDADVAVKMGKIMKDRLRMLGMTQTQVTEALCISDGTLCKWLQGERFMHAVPVIRLLAMLGLNPADLLDDQKMAEQPDEVNSIAAFVRMKSQARRFARDWSAQQKSEIVKVMFEGSEGGK